MVIISYMCVILVYFLGLFWNLKIISNQYVLTFVSKRKKFTFLSSVKCEPPDPVKFATASWRPPWFHDFSSFLLPFVFHDSFNKSILSSRTCNGCLMSTQASCNLFTALESISDKIKLGKDLLSPNYVPGTARCSTCNTLCNPNTTTLNEILFCTQFIDAHSHKLIDSEGQWIQSPNSQPP